MKRSRKREMMRRLVIERLQEVGESHIRDLTLYVEENSRYWISPTGLANVLRQSISEGVIGRSDTTTNKSFYFLK